MTIMRLSLFTLLIIVQSLCAGAQSPASKEYVNLITNENLKDNLSILASDALEGRETGTRGQKMAAAFIKKHFQDIGLSGPVNGDYYQDVPLYVSKPGETYLMIGKEKFTNLKDVLYYGRGGKAEPVTVSAVFAGSGSKETFDAIDVTDKAVVIAVSKEDGFREQVRLARERKAKTVIAFFEDRQALDELIGQYKRSPFGSRLSLTKPEHGEAEGIFMVTAEIAAKIFNSSPEKLLAAAKETSLKKGIGKIKEGKVTWQAETKAEAVISENVLGYLEGTDKKDELIVITAHYDHIGKRSSGTGDLINNGADDDGSGTVAVMEIARAFTQAKAAGQGPRRSILFMLVTAEEKGLLGSDYYTQNPVFPLANTVVNLNIDMVGRRDPQHKDSAPYVYVIGSDKLSSELHSLSETINANNLKLIFDYTYNDQNHPDRLYYRSDHWNFAKNNIPIIFYFDGIHEDYHKPSDEVDKIEFDLLRQRTQTVFLTAWEIANREARIRVDAK